MNEKIQKLIDKTTISPGKALFIVGPQGSGKTTLADAVAKKYGGGQHITLERAVTCGFNQMGTESAVCIIDVDILTTCKVDDFLSKVKGIVCGNPGVKFIFCFQDHAWEPLRELPSNQRRIEVISLSDHRTSA